MQAAKRKLTDVDKEAILKMARINLPPVVISRKLGIDGKTVSGVVSMARRHGGLPPGPFAPPVAFPMLSEADQLRALDKKWRKSKPDAEFSIHTAAGQKVYIAAYKGGVVLKIGEQKKMVALLTPSMASRVGIKLGELANWSRFP